MGAAVRNPWLEAECRAQLTELETHSLTEFMLPVFEWRIHETTSTSEGYLNVTENGGGVTSPLATGFEHRL